MLAVPDAKRETIAMPPPDDLNKEMNTLRPKPPSAAGNVRHKRLLFPVVFLLPVTS